MELRTDLIFLNIGSDAAWQQLEIGVSAQLIELDENVSLTLTYVQKK